MTGKQLYAKLINLRNQSGRQHYERIKLAATLLKDTDWIVDPTGGGGDEDKALTRLENECLADLCSWMSLLQLLDLYDNFPNVEDWEKHKYNFRKMWAEWKAIQKPQPKKSKVREHQRQAPNLPTPAEFAQQTPGEQRKSYEKVLKREETLQEKCDKLENENIRLKSENTKLKEELSEFKNKAKLLLA